MTDLMVLKAFQTRSQRFRAGSPVTKASLVAAGVDVATMLARGFLSDDSADLAPLPAAQAHRNKKMSPAA